VWTVCYYRPMKTLELNWLGSPQVKVDGEAVRLETRKVSALLAVLSLDRRPQSREYLATLLWPEYDPRRAPANLRRALASLQASLGPGWVQADREAIVLTGRGRIRADIEDLLAIVGQARAHHPKQVDSLCASCTEKLQDAVRLYRGDFLEGFNLKDCPEFDRWQMEWREELSQQMGWALERLAEAYGESGRWEQAIQMARRWLALDELHEPAHRTLMFLYARSGKRSAALRQYDTCLRLLQAEFSQEPEEATRSLAESIRLRKLEPARAEPPEGRSPPAPSPRPEKVPAAASTADVLPTRLRPPPGRPALVQRARLLSLLDEGTRRPLTLVSAPAGFGKTTLLAEWARGCGLPVAWLSLEEADSDGAHLLSSLVAALGKVDPEIGVEAWQMLHAIQSPPLSAVADSLLRDLDRRPAQRVLVIDDYHLVSRPEVENTMSEIVERLPEDLHLFIATRVDPGLPLARMRARAQLAEVRAEDLRFLPEEAADFLRQVMGLDLEEEDIAVLEQRTEGWPAGLQMAALSLQKREDRSAFIRRFGGSHRYIMDYLVVEVLKELPEEVQEFLLGTSILGRFCADLCDQLLDRCGSQEVLEQLDRENLFLVALDEERLWYRYHHLFADLLRHRLRLKREAGEIADLHLRAGRWLEKANDVEEAMRHYLTGGAFWEALRVIADQYVAILTRGGLRMLVDWASSIPEEFVVRDARACVTLGSIWGWAGRAGEAERRFARADRLLDTAEAQGQSAESQVLRGTASVMRAFLAEIAGQTARAIQLAQTADELLPAELAMTRSLIPYILSRAYRHQGDLQRAESCLGRQIQLARAANNTWSLAGAIHEMIWLCRLRGRLGQAERLLEEFDAALRQPGAAGPVAKLIAARAEIERERGHLEQAARTAEKAVQAVMRWGLPSDMCFCLQTRLRIELSAGRASAAADDLTRIDEIVHTSNVFANIIPLYEAERVRIYLARGLLSRAVSWLDDYSYPEEGSPVNREVISIARARVLLAAGRGGEAVQLLDQLATEAEAGGRAGRLLEILVLRAAAETGEAYDAALRRALELAQPEGYVRVFLDEGEPLARRLREMLDPPGGLAPDLEDYARHIISLISS
jgi:LuxR family maltose regulon positive regulatory protein